LRDAREVALRDSDAAKQELKSLRSQFDLLSSEHRQLECKYEAQVTLSFMLLQCFDFHSHDSDQIHCQMSELRSLLKIKAFELDRATVRAEESAKECRTLKLECEQVSLQHFLNDVYLVTLVRLTRGLHSGSCAFRCAAFGACHATDGIFAASRRAGNRTRTRQRQAFHPTFFLVICRRFILICLFTMFRLRSFDQLEYELDFHLMDQQDGSSGVVENRNAAEVV
jgi:hypothetical protein